MIKTKNILGTVIIAIVLFLSFSANTFAAETAVDRYTASADVVYEKGEMYSVNGVLYFIEENGRVTVNGAAAEGVPERVELLPELGGFTVTNIGVGAFYKCKDIKEVVIPETVTVISHLAFEYSGLTDIEIRGRNVNVCTRFRGTPYRDNDEHWIHEDDNGLDDVFVVSGYAVEAFVSGEFVLGEEIIGIGEKCFQYGNNCMTKLTVLNPDCYFADAQNLFPSHTVLCGYKGSAAEQYAQQWGYKFSVICNCSDAVFVPATHSYCNGTVGYVAGYWCAQCNAYVSGGVVDTNIIHSDSDGDNVCDLCGNGTDTPIPKAGQCGEQAVWFINEDGVLRISGRGNVYRYSESQREPWYAYKDEIRAFVVDHGIHSLNGISFKNYEKLETAEMADSVSSLPKTFENCTALKNVCFSRSIRYIPSHCFWKCTSLESIFLPENITEIENHAFCKCTNLSEIDFETGYVRIGIDVFVGTAAYNNPDNMREGCLYIDNCLIKELVPGATSVVLGEEITSIASNWKLPFDSQVTELSVYNPDCVFPSNTSVVLSSDTLKGYAGSTAQAYRQKFGGNFEYLAPHTHVEEIDIPAIMPTETQPGYTHRSHCSVCGEKMSERQLISHDEFDIVFNNGAITAKKKDSATSEADGMNMTVTFTVRNDVCLSSISQTVIYKVGEVKLSETAFVYNGKEQKPEVSVKNSKGEPLANGRDYVVTYPSNSKYCGSYSVRIHYIGNYAGTKSLDYTIYIAAVHPQVVSFSDESIMLNWETGHSDLVYRVYAEDQNGTLSMIADTENGSYEISSLDAQTEYRFLVRAYVTDSDGNTYWGETGDVLVCETNAETVNNIFIKLFKNLIAKIKYILQILLVAK